jgi:hypothetical protein
MGRALLSWVGFAVLVGLAVVSAGWGGGPPRGPSQAPAPTPSRSHAAYVVGARAARVDDLTRLDLPAGFHRVRPRDRAERDADDRLEVCGRPVPDTGHRLGVHGRDFATASGQRVRTLVSVYAPGAVEAVLDRLRATTSACAAPVAAQPVQQPDTMALRVRLPAPSGGPGVARHAELVALRRGDVLTLLHVEGMPAPRTLDLARLLDRRLLR